MSLRLASISALALSSAAFAQVITVTAQDRYMEGTTVSTNSGSTVTNGPFRIDAPEGDFGSWIQTWSVSGNMTASGDQRSGFNGTDTILIDYYTMSMSGGGGPDSSGSATFTNKCQFTFTVNQAATYTLNGQFSTGPSVSVDFSLVGPNTNLTGHADGTTAPVTFSDATGNLAPGSYTITLNGTGTISYVGPGGNGSGAGGTIPCISFVVTPAGGGCSADFNNDSVVDFFDYLDFVDAFANNDPSSDFNNDSVIDFFDYLDFVDAFSVGC
jgi:hypothetical protein